MKSHTIPRNKRDRSRRARPKPARPENSPALECWVKERRSAESQRDGRIVAVLSSLRDWSGLVDEDPSAEALGYFLPVLDGTINAFLDVNRFSPVYFVSGYQRVSEKWGCMGRDAFPKASDREGVFRRAEKLPRWLAHPPTSAIPFLLPGGRLGKPSLPWRLRGTRLFKHTFSD